VSWRRLPLPKELAMLHRIGLQERSLRTEVRPCYGHMPTCKINDHEDDVEHAYGDGIEGDDVGGDEKLLYMYTALMNGYAIWYP